MTTNDKFTFFGKGVFNQEKSEWVLRKKPMQSVDITWVYDYIISDRARKATEGLRAMPTTATKTERGNFKKANFEYVTFCGIFPYRDASSLEMRSPYICLDIDDLSSMEEARRVQHMLCQDQYVETALCFVSPSGRGVKWVVELPEWTQGLPFLNQWYKLRNHLAFHYGLIADPTGKDVCRACFLPHDEFCYINSKYQDNNL
ncbi:MAG: hypothetical protein J6W52_02165 [Bacteroidaceae bacterium]|nr:hypothetical protein [Bacteroidaceae bacterium]